MKTQFSLIILLVGCIGLFVACQSSDSKAVRDAARNSLPKAPAAPAAPTTPTGTPAAPPPTFASTGVAHYTCPNACEGSGGDGAGTCPTCGTTYEHNQAWHNQQGAATTTPTTPTPTNSTATTVPTTSSLGTPGAPPTTPTRTPEPAQNADGVWHYTCPSGCAGGGGGATACATCGTTLAHNTAYH